MPESVKKMLLEIERLDDKPAPVPEVKVPEVKVPEVQAPRCPHLAAT